MKPFDLKKALAGEPVITRYGRPVKIAGYNEQARNDYSVLGWVNNVVFVWHRNGKRAGCLHESDNDLFMAPTERKEWVILWTNTHGGRQAHVVNFLENAQEYKEFLDGRNFTDISIHEITIHD
jgi:hypothetical protein